MERWRMKERVAFFVNRQRELGELKNSILHVVIVGHRRMGKTHLIIKHLLNSRSKKTIPVYLDMLYFSSWEEFAQRLMEEFLSAYDETTHGTFAILFNRVSSSLSSALSSVKEIEGTLGTEGLKFFSLRLAFEEKKKDEFELLRGALDFISAFARKQGMQVVLVLDEIQNIQGYGHLQKGLGILRGQLQFTKNIRLILSGSLPSFIHSNILQKSKPFWKQLKALDVGPFDQDTVRETARATGIHEKEGNRVFTITRGVPDYVIKVLNRMKKQKTAEAAWEDVMKDEELFFSSLISSLSRAEHTALNRIARGEGYTPIARALGYPPTAVLKSLITQGLIQKSEAGKYEIVDPGLEYLLQH